jgi:hypothetical protein
MPFLQNSLLVFTDFISTRLETYAERDVRAHATIIM